MEYPDALNTNGRPTLSKEEILADNYLYQRHKPGIDWVEKEGLPDFSKIKIDPKKPENNQSYNWDRYSEPHWVRFNPQKEYQIEYAVVGYLTETIRNLKNYNSKLLNNFLDVEHVPVDINYSHCQLSCDRGATKSVRREMRKTLRHKVKVYLNPYEEAS